MMRLVRLLPRVALGACALWLASAAWAQRSAIATVRPLPFDLTPRVNLEDCGHFRGHFGPIDFRTAHPLDRQNVEANHLQMEMRTFLGGQLVGRNIAGVGSVVWGFQYVLKSFPNHPAVLLIMDQLGRKLKSEYPQGSETPLECWYMRAFMIAPDDPAVRTLYGVYLANRGRTEEALANLKVGDAGTRNVPGLQHQIGLAYLELKQYRLAQLNALRLAKSGFPIDSVARSLQASGKWDAALALPAEEPAAEPAEDGAGNAASAPAAAASSGKP